MRLALTATFAVLALSACQKAPAAETEPKADATETAIPVEPDGGIGDGAPPLAGETIGAGNAIPAAFQGRWGMTANDCDPAQADVAKGLMVVSGNRLEFYESVGTLDDIESVSATRLAGDFNFTGEGMEWERDITMDLQDNGRTLIRRETGEDAIPGPLNYSRCDT